jgi:hypothetical protein
MKKIAIFFALIGILLMSGCGTVSCRYPDDGTAPIPIIIYRIISQPSKPKENKDKQSEKPKESGAKTETENSETIK